MEEKAQERLKLNSQTVDEKDYSHIVHKVDSPIGEIWVTYKEMTIHQVNDLQGNDVHPISCLKWSSTLFTSCFNQES